MIPKSFKTHNNVWHFLSKFKLNFLQKKMRGCP